MLILNKDFKNIQKKAEEYFEEVGISTTPGSIARLFSSIINNEISEFYETLSVYHLQCFVSTATGMYLDHIGRLLSCDRLEKETDDNYRFRITNQVLSVASANKTSIKLAALSVEGVDSVVLIPFSKGAGSFDLFVVNNNGELNDTIINNVKKEVVKVIGYGINCNVSEPRYKKVDIKIKLLYKNSIQYIDTDEINEKTRKNIYNYINSLEIGEELILNKLNSIIMNSDKNISNFICDDFKINDIKCAFTNQYIKSNEKLIVNNNYNSIIVN